MGATGSVGTNGLEVIAQNSNLYKIGSLTSGNDAQKLANCALKFNPEMVAIANESKYLELKSLLSGQNIKVLAGEDGVLEAASFKADITLSAVAGFIGLKSTMVSLKNSKILALANKESVVCGGKFLFDEAEKFKTKIIPVDSEHNALFQVYERNNASNISKITITASGGPFRDFTTSQMQHITPQMALKHPNWQMGSKISVDSATLANKGLEFIEAGVLFKVDPKNIEVLIHPESIIHGMVHYTDGSVLAHLAMPDMKVSIAHAFAYPKRITIDHNQLNLAKTAALNFSEPDYNRFPMLQLAMQCFNSGPNLVIAYNAANEVAVDAFLNKKIHFLDIHEVVDKLLTKINPVDLSNIADVYHHDHMIRQQASEIVDNIILK